MWQNATTIIRLIKMVFQACTVVPDCCIQYAALAFLVTALITQVKRRLLSSFTSQVECRFLFELDLKVSIKTR